MTATDVLALIQHQSICNYHVELGLDLLFISVPVEHQTK